MRPFLVVACVALVSGCAIRYDHAGLSRVGIGLWGFGDPPGVNWNLDWPPRREIPELPPRREIPELPPRSPRESPDLPRAFTGAFDDALGAPERNAGASRDAVIDDDRCPAAGNGFADDVSPSARADPRDSSAARP